LSSPKDGIEFGILGPFEASRGGQPLAIGAGKQRLIDALWGERPPPSALNSVHIYISQLRKALGDGRLETRGRGYRLALEPEQLDLGRFERLLGNGRELLASGDAARAAKTLREALSLWRGPPLADVASEPFAHAEIARLEELRVAALEERIDADLTLGRHAELVPELERLVREHPLRERLRAQLMLALYRSGRHSEALEAYQQARKLLSTELGLEPGRALRELEAAILRQDAKLDPPRRPAGPPQRARRRRRLVLAIGAALLAAAVVAGFELGGKGPTPAQVLPNSLVRIDPTSLKPSQVVPIGPRADLVVLAGGYVWITHGLLRHTDDEGLRDAGDRTLTRVDVSTGEARVVGGGLAPCGIAADPSGDVWVANCFASGRSANVVRVDARTLEFEETWPVPARAGYYRGMAYGGGSLWLADVSGAGDYRRLTQLDPRTGARRLIQLARHAAALAWSEGYGDLWMTNFARGTVSRMHAATGGVKTSESVANNPGALVVNGDAVWVGDWDIPDVVRLPAVGSGSPRHISLRVRTRPAGVTSVAAGAGAIWAAVPHDRAVWRIDPKTNRATRIDLRYFPWGVAVGDNGIWVALRARDTA
jgi:DNA-binding SARP family transcriptional activator/streptogramin lyase